MLSSLSAVAALAVIAAVAAPVPGMAQSTDLANVGTLTCDVSGGIGAIIASRKDLSCTYTPAQPGPSELYMGSISKLGLDIGATSGGVMVWAVFAPTNLSRGALAGHYAGATAEATVGAGLGANVLVGGSNHTISLQPLSVQGQTGLNVAAGVAGLDLQSAQ